MVFFLTSSAVNKWVPAVQYPGALGWGVTSSPMLKYDIVLFKYSLCFGPPNSQAPDPTVSPVGVRTQTGMPSPLESVPWCQDPSGRSSLTAVGCRRHWKALLFKALGFEFTQEVPGCHKKKSQQLTLASPSEIRHILCPGLIEH